MTAILQISDPHIAASGALVSGRLDTAGSLRRAVERVVDIRDQIGPIDALLLSGDLSDDGSAESYVHLKEILAPLDLPLLVIPGNHDGRAPLRAAFPEILPRTGGLNWSRRVGDVLVVGLDTLREGEGGGALDPDALSFLTQALADPETPPVLLALHHPPFRTGIQFMDDIGLADPETLEAILAAYPGELRLTCGHIHSMMVTTFAGKIAVSSPSPCSSFAYDLRAGAPVGFMDEEDGFLIHRWYGGFQTIRVGLHAAPGPFPFNAPQPSTPS